MIRRRRLTAHDIKRRAGNRPVVQGGDQVMFINQPAARCVDQDRAFLHAGEFRGGDQARGLGCQGRNGYDIRLFG